MRKISLIIIVTTSLLTLISCSQNPTLGGAQMLTTGAAAGGNSVGENGQLEKCSQSLGTLSIVENRQATWFGVLTSEYKLPPTANLLKLLIQQSNCFVVVERGLNGMSAIAQEQALANSGQLRKTSKMHRGQMVASDYAMSPEIVFSADNTGGAGFGTVAGDVVSMFSPTAGRIVGGLAGTSKTREASALLTLMDTRSSVQIASSQGSSSKTDWGIIGGLFGGISRVSVGAGAGGYTNTPEGKVIAGAFMDAYNNMVRAVRNYKAQNVKGGLGAGGQLKVQSD